MLGAGRCGTQGRSLDPFSLRLGRPHQAEAREEERGSDARHEGGDTQTDLEGRSGHAPDTKLADERVCRWGPDLLAGRTLDRVGAVEAGPIAAVVLELVGAGLEDRAVL